MSLCSRTCGITVPEPLSNQCTPELRGGGVSYILFAACDWQLCDPYNLADWACGVVNGNVGITLEVLGQKPKASAVKKKMSSCRTEAITGFDYTVTFQDYNADNTEFKDFDFWNVIQTYYQSYHVGFITCDGLLYGYYPDMKNLIPNFSIEVSLVIEEDFNGSTYWDGAITWKGKYETKPVYVPNLLNVLKAGQDAYTFAMPYTTSSCNLDC